MNCIQSNHVRSVILRLFGTNITALSNAYRKANYNIAYCMQGEIQ